MALHFKGLLRAIGLSGMLAAGLAHAGGLRIAIVERERHCRAGEVATRTVRLTNDGAATSTLRLAWTAAITPAVLESGTLTAQAPPLQQVEFPLRLKLPPVRRAVEARLVLGAQAGSGERVELVDRLRVYPKRLDLPWAFLKTRRIGVFDPGGGLTARLRALGARPEIQLSLRDAEDFAGDLLVVGEGCFSSVAQWLRWREAVRRHGGPGTSVMALHQAFAESDAPGDWAEPELTTAGKAALRELDPEDLAGWRGGGALRGPWLPEPAGAFVCLMRPAGMDHQAALLVESLGGGRVLVRCQAPLLSRWNAEPGCEMLLNTLIRKALDGGLKGEWANGKRPGDEREIEPCGNI